MWTLLEKLEKIQFDNYMSEKFKVHLFEARSFCGALCFLVMLLSTYTIANPLKISVLDSALRSEYPEVYPPGSEPGFTRNKVFFKLNGDDPDQIRLSLDSTRNELHFDPRILEALEGLILPELYEIVKAQQSKDGVTLSSLQAIGLPVQMGKHALLMIPVPEDKKHPNQRPPRTKDNVPPVLAKESEELNKQLVANWAAPAPSVSMDSSAWTKAQSKPYPKDSIIQNDLNSNPNALRLKLDDDPIGETVIEWNEDRTEFSFRSPKLVESLNMIAPANEKEKVEQREGWFQSKNLKYVGMVISMDTTLKLLSLISPTSWKKPIAEEKPELAPMDTIQTDYSQLSKDELFSRIFKKAPPPRMQEFTVRLFVENEELEQVTLKWNSNFTEYTFFSTMFRQYLDTTLTQEIRKSVNGLDGNFHSTRLVRERFIVELDEAEFVLKVRIPGEFKQLQIHQIARAEDDLLGGKQIKPALISAYLNSHFYQDFSYSERFRSDDSSKMFYSQANSARPERRPFFVDLDGAGRFQNWVLQSTATLTEPSNGSWTRHQVVRKESQLIRDFYSLNSRLTLIDVSPNYSSAKWNAPLIGGARFDYSNALVGNSIDSDNQIMFQLIRQAKVEIYQNGQLIKTLELSSGTHRVQGFSGRSGQNIVEVQVTYDDGFKQVIPFEYMQAYPRNLKKGESEVKTTVGVNRITSQGSPAYETESSRDRIVTGIYHYGLSYRSTISGYSGITNDLQVGGAKVLWNSDSSSTWEFSQTASHSRDNLTGLLSEISLSKHYTNYSTRVFGTWTKRSFRNYFFSPLNIEPKVQYSAGFSANAPILYGSGSVSLSANINHKDSLYAPVDYTMGFGYSLQAFKGFSLNANASIVVSQWTINPTLTLTTSYFFHRGSHSGYLLNSLQNRKVYVPPSVDVHRMSIDSTRQYTYDSIDFKPGYFDQQWKNMLNAGWSWSDGMGVVGGNAYSANATFESLRAYNARLAYQHTANYGIFSGSYAMSDQRESMLMARSHYLVARASSSLMFADGLFGIGRPVYQGFVLVNGVEDLESTVIRVNPSETFSSEYSHSNAFLSAGYGEFSSYHTENIQVKLASPPPGAVLENDRYSFDNTYKQGFALRLGKAPTVLIRARILDESNQPISYTTFQIFEIGEPSQKPIYQSFTNKSGILQAGNLKPGKSYIIHFGESAFIKNLTIKIPEKSRGIYDFGDLHVNHEILASKLAVKF